MNVQTIGKIGFYGAATLLMITAGSIAYKSCQEINKINNNSQTNNEYYNKELETNNNYPESTPIEDVAKHENAPFQPQKNYVFSEKSDSYFLANGVPLDSVLAYPKFTIQVISSNMENVKDLAKIYRLGLIPSIAKEYKHLGIRELLFCAENNMGPALYNELPNLEKLSVSRDFVTLMNKKNLSPEDMLNEYRALKRIDVLEGVSKDYNMKDFMEKLLKVESFSLAEPYFEKGKNNNTTLNYEDIIKLRKEKITPKDLDEELIAYKNIIETCKMPRAYKLNEFSKILSVTGKISDLKKYLELNEKYDAKFDFEDADYFSDNNISLKIVEEEVKKIQEENFRSQIRERAKK